MVEATPYPWPFDGRMMPSKTALLLVAPQTAFAWMDATGRVGRLCRALLTACQQAGVTVCMVRLTRRPATPPRLSGMPAEADPGWEWLSGVQPPESALCIEAPCLDAFYATGLDAVLWQRGLTHLVLAGFGTETAIHSTLRSANDRGFECLVIEDACADGDADLHAAAMSSIMMSGGIFGAYTTSSNWLTALAP